MGALILVAILIVFGIVIVVTNVVIVSQSMTYVVERLGGYYATWGTGIHFKIPFIDRVARKISMKEQVIDFEPQPVITKDNVTMQIDSIVFLQVTDSKLYAYGVENPMAAIENLTATTLRNIIGDMELDHTLTSRDVINTQITATLDEATDKWGIKVNRVELRNILPPREIQEAMEKQMKAERERRAQNLMAEAEKRSSVLVAEGQKQSEILKAEGDRQSQILRAQAEKEAQILHAEGVREQKIQVAEGEAQAIRMVQQAYADSLEMIKSAGADERVIQLKSLETLAKMGDGKATKIVIPSELQSLAGLAITAKEMFTEPKDGAVVPKA